MGKFITCKHKSQKDKKREQKQMEAIKEYRKKKKKDKSAALPFLYAFGWGLLRCIHSSTEYNHLCNALYCRGLN